MEQLLAWWLRSPNVGNANNVRIMTREHADECFQSWVAHASKGDCYKLIQSMTEYYYNLWEVI